jgi:hypothetical protein
LAGYDFCYYEGVCKKCSDKLGIYNLDDLHSYIKAKEHVISNINL